MSLLHEAGFSVGLPPIELHVDAAVLHPGKPERVLSLQDLQCLVHDVDNEDPYGHPSIDFLNNAFERGWRVPVQRNEDGVVINYDELVTAARELDANPYGHSRVAASIIHRSLESNIFGRLSGFTIY